MAAPLYTRYVPPKPSSKSKAKALSPSLSENEESSKKRKRETKGSHSKKRSKTEGHDSTEVLDSSAANGTVNVTVNGQREAENAHKSKKKAKRREGEDVAEANGEYGENSKNKLKEKSHFDKGYEKSNGDAKENKHKKREKKMQDAELKSRKKAESEGISVDDRHKTVLSKYEKSIKHSKERPKSPTPVAQDVDDTSELRDIVPIPVPDELVDETSAPTFASLPSWQVEPIVASSGNRKPFHELKVDSQLVETLSRKGFDQALPIQSAVLPLLLPIPSQHAGDLCVSAATGSGKTLAYALPIVQSLKPRAIVKLRAIVVVPTRELVVQIRNVVEICASGSNLKIGTAVGNHKFSREQDSLVEKSWRFDPKALGKTQDETGSLEENSNLNIADDVLDDPDIDGDEDKEDALPGHVREYHSQVDILICTPGRLVEHIKSTKGFTLRNLRWLVIDEADRLLGESFQEWSTVLLAAMHLSRKDLLPQELINHPIFTHFIPNIEPERVRKVLLSATMTRDMDKLIPLDLWNPKLVVLDKHEQEEAKTDQEMMKRGLQLPSALEEYGIPVKDSSQKPLYLLHLLRNIMPLQDPLHKTRHARGNDNVLKEEVLSNGSDSDSSRSKYASSASSSDDDDSSTSEASNSDEDIESLSEDHYTSATTQPKHTTGSQSALIFTSSNEATSRLSALLSYLDPTLSSTISTITKSSSVSGRSLSNSVKSGRIRLLIATDRIARGLDLPDLGNVINYDVPRNMSSYIHRVGRTARANNSGRAWTLVEDREGAWFWKDLAKGAEMDRGNKTVKRVNVDTSVFTDEMTDRYTEALRRLKEDVRA